MKTASQCVLITALCLLFSLSTSHAQENGSAGAGPQVAQPEQGGVNWKGVGIGAGTVASNVVYIPLKLTYGILGGIAGGAGYALTGGNKQVAETVWRSSLGGDYVLTPDMITGQQRIHFSGPGSTAPEQATGSSSAPSNMPQDAANGTAALSSAATQRSDSLLATHPIDSGAGPVNTKLPPPSSGTSVNNSADSYSNPHPGSTPAFKAPPLPDTSIE